MNTLIIAIFSPLKKHVSLMFSQTFIIFMIHSPSQQIIFQMSVWYGLFKNMFLIFFFKPNYRIPVTCSVGFIHFLFFLFFFIHPINHDLIACNDFLIGCTFWHRGNVSPIFIRHWRTQNVPATLQLNVEAD